jgi:hypothetical protein
VFCFLYRCLVHIVNLSLGIFLHFFFLEVLGFDRRTLCWLGRHSTSWTMPVALFALVIFEVGSYFLPWVAWTVIIVFMLPA